jgi:hypothetical protein
MQETGRTAYDAVGYAGFRVCQSGGVISKPGRKKREIEKNPDYARQMRERRKWLKSFGEGATAGSDIWPNYIIARYQGGVVRRIGTGKNPNQDVRAVIEKHGLARQIWKIMAAKFAAMKGGQFSDGRSERYSGTWYAVRRYMSKFGSDKRAAGADITNRLSYAAVAYPGIEARAVANGAAALAQELERKMKTVEFRAQQQLDRAAA